MAVIAPQTNTNIPTNNITNPKTASNDTTDAASTQLFKNTQDFIKLLTVQLQNQDPTKPLETDQLTQQIASLSQVEQQINTNKNLQSLMAAYSQSQVSSNVNYIGRLVESPGNQGMLMNGQAVFVYGLEHEARSVKVSVKDAQGNVVYSGDGTTFAGRNQVVWDGTTSQNKVAPDGVYSISITAKDADGTDVKATTSTAGVVTSLETVDGTNYLALGDIKITPDKVVSVRNMPTA